MQAKFQNFMINLNILLRILIFSSLCINMKEFLKFTPWNNLLTIKLRIIPVLFMK